MTESATWVPPPAGGDPTPDQLSGGGGEPLDQDTAARAHEGRREQ
jgi:hypothetical protein